jgi:hypothetical protein
MDSEPTRRLPPPEAHQYLRQTHGISRTVQTLAKIRCTRDDGPAYVRDGRRVLYETDALDEYAARVLSAPRRSTREVAA